jgi:hypothetical protein
MSNFDYEGFSEGEWEERGELAWNEFDWERYLRSQDKAFRRYLELYAQLKGRMDRLDRVAQMMGWDTEEWTGNEYLQDEDGSGTSGADEDDDQDDLDPYTLHKHPIFIATKSLYLDVQGRWLDLLGSGDSQIPPAVAGAYQASLSVGESNAISAIHALDMGDYAMAVCQFKRALADLNRSFHLLERVSRNRTDAVAQYQTEATRRLFDLREIWLRVMQYCREEVNRRIRGDD